MLWWMFDILLRLLGAGIGPESLVIRGPPGLDHRERAASPGSFGLHIPRTGGVRSRAIVRNRGCGLQAVQHTETLAETAGNTGDPHKVHPHPT